VKILVTGSKGQVGWELEKQGPEKGFDVIGVDIEELDITDKIATQSFVEETAVDLIVNAAAYTAVDRAEDESVAAFKVNRDGPANLASACSRAGIPLVHISTDYVYGGDRQGACREEDPVSPRGVYAESKADGDRAVVQLLENHIILRIAWVYGVHGHNFVKTMLRLGQEKDRLTVVDDQVGCPTFAADTADAILSMAEKVLHGESRAWGVYHYCGKGATSWFGFARKIFEIAGQYQSLKVGTVEPVPTSAYPTAAERPVNSVLDCSKITRTFGIAPRPWEESLAEMLERLYGDDQA